MTLDWVPLSVREELEAVKNYLPASKYIGYLTESIKDTLKKAGDLDRFLMETFALLQSSISIMEAGMSNLGNKRAEDKCSLDWHFSTCRCPLLQAFLG